jgi:glycosyltransferase involved in cell wall biosynthesis
LTLVALAKWVRLTLVARRNNKCMKILISVSYYAPHISGLTNSIKNLAEGLANKTNSISVLTTQHKRTLSLNEVINKVQVYRVPYALKLQKGFIMPFYFIPLIKQLWKNDCIFINLPQAEGIIGAIVARLLGKKVVSVYACEVSLPKSFSTFIIEQVLTFSHFVTLTLSHKVVTLSDDYAEHTKLLHHFKKKTVEIYPYIKNPIRSSSFTVESDKKYRIGFLGRISAEKGLEYLLEAVPILKKQLGDNFVLLLAGPKAVGEEKYIQRIESLAKKHSNNVEFVSELADNKMAAFYASLDVLVLPSINATEAFGMVQVEAMLCGIPVVASNLPGVRVPVLETGMGEIAKKEDSVDLANKIVKVIKNKNDYVKRKSIVKEVFDSKKVVGEYEKVLGEVLAY